MMADKERQVLSENGSAKLRYERGEVFFDREAL
jgi:hypothetical protein